MAIDRANILHILDELDDHYLNNRVDKYAYEKLRKKFLGILARLEVNYQSDMFSSKLYN